MHIRTYKFTAEDVDCQYCAQYSRRRCIAPDGCPYIAERIEAGVVDFGEVLQGTFRNPSVLLRLRLRHMASEYPNTMWQDADHAQRFQRIRAVLGTNTKRDTPQFLAAMYLLTANEEIYRRSYQAFLRTGFAPSRIRISGISVPDYALVQAAKSLCSGSSSFTLGDLVDTEAVDEQTFRLVVNAILIARYGLGVMQIRRGI